ncbi:MAG: SHOCT domain-containing protein [Nitrosopumilaceae archaeon]
MELKSEKSLKEYLKTLPDETIIKYYMDVEYTPFPVLVIQEYQRRFKRKAKDEILRNLNFEARLAKRKVEQISRMAKRKKLIDDVTRQKSEEVFSQAKKKGYEISETLAKKGTILSEKLRKEAQKRVKSGIKAGKSLRPSSSKQLALLEKLDELRKAGVISQKEFREKKKKILSKI